MRVSPDCLYRQIFTTAFWTFERSTYGLELILKRSESNDTKRLSRSHPAGGSHENWKTARRLMTVQRGACVSFDDQSTRHDEPTDDSIAVWSPLTMCLQYPSRFNEVLADFIVNYRLIILHCGDRSWTTRTSRRCRPDADIFRESCSARMELSLEMHLTFMN